MSAPQRRPPSPLAHGPDEECASCRECPSCDGGSGRIPRQYRVERRGSEATGFALLATCTRCEGSGIACPNFRPDLPPPSERTPAR